MKSGVFSNIQVLRGFAALIVVVYHLQPMINASFGTDFSSHIGAYGVDVFFVISGFVMFLKNENNPENIPKFFVLRLIRIVPLYWCATCFVAVIYMFGFNPNGLNYLDFEIFIKSIFFIPSEFENGRHDLALSLGWTLMYELFFYFLFGISFFLRKREKSFVAVSAAILCLAVIGTFSDGWSYLQKYFFASIMIEFLFGGFVAIIYSRVVSRGASQTLILGCSLVALSFILLTLIYIGDFIDTSRFGFRFILFGLPALFLVLGAVLVEHSGWKITNKPVLLIGDASYSLYLFHPVFLQATVKVTAFALPAGLVSGIGAGFVAICVAVASSLFIYFCVEKSIVSFGKRAAKRMNRKSLKIV